MRSLLPFLALCLLGAPLAAQTTWFVDPLSGADTNTGGAQDPFLSVTHALTVAVSGDRVELLPGTYTAANEAYPIPVKDGVSIVYPGSGRLAVFDSNGASSTFEVRTSLTTGATLDGMRITGGVDGVFVDPAVSLGGTGLAVTRASFDAFSDAGVDAAIDLGANNRLTVSGCTFSPTTANAGVRIALAGSNVGLGTSNVEDCTFTNCTIGIEVSASGGAVINNTNQILRNDISFSSTAGIRVSASATSSLGATNSVVVQGNKVQSSGSGLEITVTSTTGPTTVCDGAVSYNLFGGFQSGLGNTNAVVLTTTAALGSVADLTCSFTGNVMAGSTANGVLFQVTAPQTGARNNDPDFGTSGNGTGRNTFKNNGSFAMSLDLDMNNAIQAQQNFWGLNGSTAILNRIENALSVSAPPVVSPWLLDSLGGVVSPSQIGENVARTITVTGSSTTRFVDNPDDAATVGQMSAILTFGGVPVATLVPHVFSNGTGFTFVSPLINESGLYGIQIVLPGGQTGTLPLTVGGGSGGGSSGGCVIATAAHGDYDAREVRVLRRFRDDYLMATPLGRDLTRAYYRNGPPVAEYIADHDWAASAVRTALVLPVALAEAFVRWNAAARLLAGLVLLGLAFRVLRKSS